VEFGLKTIRTKKVRQLPLDCPWKRKFHLLLHI
jgi:hypothetical protein